MFSPPTKTSTIHYTQHVTSTLEEVQLSLQDMIDNIQMDIANFGLSSHKPGWIVQAIIKSFIFIHVLNPIVARNPYFVSLPDEIKYKQAVVKVKTPKGDKNIVFSAVCHYTECFKNGRLKV
jgi:hypothetical protein